MTEKIVFVELSPGWDEPAVEVEDVQHGDVPVELLDPAVEILKGGAQFREDDAPQPHLQHRFYERGDVVVKQDDLVSRSFNFFFLPQSFCDNKLERLSLASFFCPVKCLRVGLEQAQVEQVSPRLPFALPEAIFLVVSDLWVT